ncbi:MAG TPA: hypothetical protein VM846_04140 [Vicinamibacterales bacterium]|nr:hypothetical protein [Vicinamibacterales bacterium]
MKLRILIACVVSLTAAGLMGAAPSDSSGLVVHEWGTFLAMNGSDGVSLDGMYHEEHALPSFVHARSRDQLRLPMSRLKGETPVIYFYPRDVMKVKVEVDFPTGLWTQWYPQASTVSPGLVQAGSPPRTRDGRISWDVIVRPPAMKNNEPPVTGRDALWNFARDVDAAYVYPDRPAGFVNTAATSASSEVERFIFYRGLGEAPLPLDVRLANGRIAATTSEREGLQHLFILRVENGRGAYSYRTALRPDQALDEAIPSMDASLPLDQFVGEVAAHVAKRLTDSGLYKPEALAMVNTWKSSYFKTDGVRLLFVLPGSWTNRFIPMRIEPAPAELVRVMVGRVELLDTARETRAEEAIRNLASPVASVRERAFVTLRSEGRYVEPIVRRALNTTTDEQVRTLSKRLLLTDFVTELRTALTDADTGERVNTEPVYLQAQLASLLREIGLTDEARKEGESALAQLARMRQPTMDDHLSRHMFRALARAHEGAGHDAEALNWYGKFVEFGSQFQQPRMCAGCHTTMGPRDMSFFRDWYAGQKFAEYAVKTGRAPRLIAAHEQTLSAAPKNLASQLSLAYLLEATGETKRAQEMWANLNR